MRTLMMVVLCGACADPPPPPAPPDPDDLPRWSRSTHVRWSGLTPGSTQLVAVFVDQPGGPMDQITMEPDVATFLNDRFQAWFLIPSVAGSFGPAPSAWLLTPAGCLLNGPFHPETAGGWITLANQASADWAAGKQGTPPVAPWKIPALNLPSHHPLRAACD